LAGRWRCLHALGIAAKLRAPHRQHHDTSQPFTPTWLASAGLGSTATMTRPIRVLELRSVRGTGGGPEKTILLGAARTDHRRFSVTVCYLRDARDDAFDIDAKAAALPVDYVEVVEKHSFDPSIWPHLRRLVRDRAIDIVHAHDHKTNVLALLMSRFENVTALSTVHGWTGHSRREHWLYYPVDKRILRFFPRLIAVSNDIRRELSRHGARPSRVVTILNGIEHTAFRRERARESSIRRALGIRDDDVVIGAVGRLEPQKRFDLLIEAFGEVHKKQPKLKLLIVGDGSVRNALAARVTARGLSSHCRLLGQRTDIIDLHHAFDMFVQSSDYEGTSNAVLEAMALETPVVATDVGGTADLVRNDADGLIIPSQDLPALVRAIEVVLADREAAAARAVAARRRVETDLSFNARMVAVEAVYEELFRRRLQINDTPAVPVRT
jgi:glycosyltransferase involved in cell wall biosynthesis